MTLLKRLLGRSDLPSGFAGVLEPEENVLASAEVTGGGHLVATSLGLWVVTGGAPRRIGWHLISKASWQNGAIVLVEASENETAGAAVIIADLPATRFRLAVPGRVPEVVHARVNSSIKTRHRKELPGGGAWFVQRKVPGRDGMVLQVRPDPGTDEAATRQVARDVATSLGLS